MTYRDRMYYEELSLIAYGSKQQYLKQMKKPQLSKPVQVGNAHGKELYGYPTLDQVEKTMLMIIKQNEGDLNEYND